MGILDHGVDNGMENTVVLEAGEMLREDVHVRNHLVHERVPVRGHFVGGVQERLA